MATKKIIVAFKNKGDQFAGAFKQIYEQKGFECETVNVSSSLAIRKELEKGQCTAVVTQYQLGATPFAHQELTMIQELDENCRIVIVLPKNFRGGEYVQRMLNAGLYYGIFEDSNTTATKICELIDTHRTRKDAKLYYGIMTEEENVTPQTAAGLVTEELRTLADYVVNGSGSEDTLLDRVAYVKTKVPQGQFETMLALLDENTRMELSKNKEYEAYFIQPLTQDRTVKGARIIADAISGFSGAIREAAAAIPEKTKVEVKFKDKYITRRVIGVLAAHKGADVVPTAVAVAKTLSMYGPVILLESARMPTTQKIYDRYGLDAAIGAGYISVPHLVQDGKYNLSQIRNLYEGINFFVANTSYGRCTSGREELLDILNGTSDNVVIAFDCDLDSAITQSMTGFLTEIILTCEQKACERYLGKVKADVSTLSEMNVPSAIVCMSDHFITKREEVNGIPIVHAHKVPEGRIYPVTTMPYDQKKLLAFLNVSQRQKAARKRSVIKLTGTQDIAIAGIAAGLGTTFTALMLADAVRRNYRVAYLELNDSGHMRTLVPEYAERNTKMFSLQGIDVYFCMTFADFSATYRKEYDYVFIDFGQLPKEKEHLDAFLMCRLHFICVSACPWKSVLLDKSASELEQLDPKHAFTLLAPISTPARVRDAELYNKGMHRNVYPVPYTEEPVDCPKTIQKRMLRLLTRKEQISEE